MPRQPPPCHGQRGDNPGQQFLSLPCRGSVWTSRSQSQNSFPPIPSQPWAMATWKYQRRQRTRRIIIFSPNTSFLAVWCRHDTNSRTVIQIIKECSTALAYNSVCNTHTHGAHTVAHCLIGKPTSLGGQSRERGGNLSPYYEIMEKIPNLHV